jgi:hypothetical protein
MKVWSILAIVLSIGLANVAAQDEPGAPPAAIKEAGSPSHLGSEAPALAIASDTESRNVLVAGFSLGAAYDNRGLYNTTTSTFSGDTRYFIESSVAFQRTFSAGSVTLSYTPGVSISTDNNSNNQYTQNLAGDVNWRPNSRFQLHARQDYSVTDNPFEIVGRVDLLPGLGGPLGPNYNGVLPDTKRTSLVSNADMDYLVSEHRAVGITGGFQKYTFDSSTPSTANVPYVNSEVITGSVFFSQQFSRAVNAGIQFAYTDIYSTGAVVARTQAPAPMVFVKLTPDSRTTITLFAGPEYARTREVIGDVGVFETGWYPTFGGTVSWNGHRNAFDVQGQRRIGNGGGVLEAVRDTTAGAAYRFRVAKRLLSEVRADWSDEKAIGLLSQGNYFESMWAGGGPVYELSRSFSLRADVAYVHQAQQGVAVVAGNHLMIQGSLDYRFHKGLGE